MTRNSFILPPEWTEQRAIWTAWPADASAWNGDLEPPRQAVRALIGALAPSNHVRLLVGSAEARASAEAALGGLAECLDSPYGDIWLRDTGPIFARGNDGPIALRFRTNGWGGKFDLPGDDIVGDDIAALAGIALRRHGFVLEGGAIDHDGAGTFLTTRQCLLNANRNGWSQAKAEEVLRSALQAKKIIWLDEGLRGDHTDGHVDNIARFAGPAHIVHQTPASPDDPNADILNDIASRLAGQTDALGRKIALTPIPSPGRVLDACGKIAPASHLNFVIANGVVVVPTFGTQTQTAALIGLQALFGDRKVIGLEATGLLGGGGAFHCITREEAYS